MGAAKDPEYEKARSGFLRDLRQFHEGRSLTNKRIPKINGKEVDLYLLYQIVTSHGGWEKINVRNEWDDLLEHFHLPRATNGGLAIKQIYLRHLELYEKIHFLGEDIETKEEEENEYDDFRHRRRYTASTKVCQPQPPPAPVPQMIGPLPDHTRAQLGLSTKLLSHVDYDRLLLSLQSPLPNDQDMAISVCMLLSNETKHVLKIHKAPQILDLLVAHAGVFNHCGLRKLISDSYSEARGLDHGTFWEENLGTEARDLLCECFVKRVDLEFETEDLDSSDLELNEADMTEEERQVLAVKRIIRSIEPTVLDDEEGFCCTACPCGGLVSQLGSAPKPKREKDSLSRSFDTEDKVGQRVFQIASILRNLSFEKDNAALMARNTTFIRFLIITANCSWCNLSQMALDTLGNVAEFIKLEDPIRDSLGSMIFSLVTSNLFSLDRYGIIRSLETLSELLKNDANEEILIRLMERKMFGRMCELLTISDIMLLIYTLECILALTGLGEEVCNELVRVQGSVAILVSLVTVEAQSYGPKGCILMRVVEKVTGNCQPFGSTQQGGALRPPPVPQPQPLLVHPPIQVQGLNSKVVMSPMVSLHSVQQANQRGTPSPPLNQNNTLSMILNSSSLAGSGIQTLAGSGIQTLAGSGIQTLAPILSPPVLRPVPPPNSVMANGPVTPAPPKSDEAWAVAWLKGAFESFSGTSIEQGEMYRMYCGARKALPLPLDQFIHCVKCAFGSSVGPVMKQFGGGSCLSFIEGIRPRIGVRAATPTSTAALTPIPSNGASSPPASPSIPLGRSVGDEPEPLTSKFISPGLPSPKPEHKGLDKEGYWNLEVAVSAEPPSVALPPAAPIIPSRENKTLSPILKATLSRPVKSKHASGVAQRQQKKLQESESPKKEGENAIGKAEMNGIEDGDGTSGSSSMNSTESYDSPNTPLPTSFQGILCNGLNAGEECKEEEEDGKKSNQKLKGMLIDLLERKVGPREPPVNGLMGNREIRISDKGLELVEKEENSNSSSVMLSNCMSSDQDSPPQSMTFYSSSPSTKMLKTMGGSAGPSDPQVTFREEEANGREPKRETVLMSGGGSGDSGEGESLTQNKLSFPHLSDDLLEKFNAISDLIVVPPEQLGRKARKVAGEKMSQNVKNVSPSSSAIRSLLASKVAQRQQKKLQESESPKKEGENAIGKAEMNGIEDGDGTSGSSSMNSTESYDSPNTPLPTSFQGILCNGLNAGEECKEEEEDGKKSNQKLKGMLIDLLERKVGPREPPVNGLMGNREIRISDKGLELVEKEENSNSSSVMLSNCMSSDQDSPPQSMTFYSSSPSTKMLKTMGGSAGPSDPQVTFREEEANGREPKRETVLMSGGGSGDSGEGESLTQNKLSFPHLSDDLLEKFNAISDLIVVPPEQLGIKRARSNSASDAEPAVKRPSLNGDGFNTNPPSPTNSLAPAPPVSPEKPLAPLRIMNQQNATGLTFSRQLVLPSGQQFLLSTSHGGSQGQPLQGQVIISKAANSGNDQMAKAIIILQQPQSSTAITTPTTNSTVTSNGSSAAQLAHQAAMEALDNEIPYLCEWTGCGQRFLKHQQVFMHAVSVHCPEELVEAVRCEWGLNGCDPLMRKRYSLMTHIQDRHCTKQALDLALYRRKNKIDPPPVAHPPIHHPGYAPNAAFHAIKRHALQFMNPKELNDDNEGPVTKSIRLTSALILRNLINYSPIGRRMIRAYESHLSSIAMSNVESSRTISQLLYEINDLSRSKDIKEDEALEIEDSFN